MAKGIIPYKALLSDAGSIFTSIRLFHSYYNNSVLLIIIAI